MTESNTVEAWVKRLGKEKMPVLGSTIREIQLIAKDDQQPLSTITEIILQDASMTASVLRLANSAYYCPAGVKLSTVSRAVMVLGFNVIRSICLTIAVVEELLKTRPRERLIKEMGRSLHAAVQARELATHYNDPSAEEIFVATLLYRLGDMVFWCFGGALADELEDEISLRGSSPAEAERKILGFRLFQLTQALAEEWHLGDLLQAALRSVGGTKARSRVIVLCHRFARTVESGWDTKEVSNQIRRIAKYSGIPAESLRPLLVQNAKQAINIAQGYGALSAADSIPLPEQFDGEKEMAQEEEPEQTEVLPSSESDPMLQLLILRELSAVSDWTTEVNTVLEMVLEGIYRGIGMDRALFALLSPDGRLIEAKSVLGLDRLFLSKYFRFERVSASPTIFFKILDEKQAQWIIPQEMPDIHDLLPKSVIQIIGSGPFFLGSAVVNNRPFGIFYADRRTSERPLDEESFESFKHFVRLGNLSLGHIGV